VQVTSFEAMYRTPSVHPSRSSAAVKHDVLELLPAARRPVLHVRRPIRQQGTSDRELNRGPPVGSWSRGALAGDEEGTSGDEQRGACRAARTSSVGGMRGRRDEQPWRWKKRPEERDRSTTAEEAGCGQ
jgi:hypothetical protein